MNQKKHNLHRQNIFAIMLIPILFVASFFLFAVISNQDLVFAQQATGSADIFQLIEAGGTLTFDTTEGIMVNFTMPADTSGELLITTTEVTDPTTTGIDIDFLGEVLTMVVNPPGACANECTLTFNFTDTHLAAAGISDPTQVTIFQDPEQDGTFIALATTLIDGAPSPYVVSAIITSTSFFGIGVINEETFCNQVIGTFDNVIEGTDRGELLRGTDGNDLINGFGGNDRISGRGGTDCLIGGEGNDFIVGGNGDDIIFGNGEKDKVYGGKGNDLIFGGSGQDNIRGFAGNDTVFGNAGNDFLRGDGGDDNLSGGQGDDSLNGGSGTDQCDGGIGTNTFKKCETQI